MSVAGFEAMVNAPVMAANGHPIEYCYCHVVHFSKTR